MKRFFTALLAACFLLSLAACGRVEKVPDTAVEERLVTVFRQGLDAAIDELKVKPFDGAPGSVYAGEFFWCGEKLETRMYFYDGQARLYGAEQTLEINEETKAHVRKCTELFLKQFGAIYSVAWVDEVRGMGTSMTFEPKDEAEATALAEEKLGQLWENPEETPVVRLRYLLPYLPSDDIHVRGTRVADMDVRISPENPTYVQIFYSMTNDDVRQLMIEG